MTPEQLTPEQIDGYADAAASHAANSALFLLSPIGKEPEQIEGFTDTVELPDGRRVVIIVKLEA